jgi:sporulation protein YlmC with PRC-barrel domain
MKWLFTTSALIASMAFASAAYAAPDDMKNTPTEVTPAEQQGTSAATETPKELLTGSLDESADVLTIDGEAAFMSATAISARDMIGASVVGPDGEEVGVVDDLALAKDRSIEQIIVADGAVFGLGGKNVAIDFLGASITRNENDERTVRIGMTAKALESVSEFDKTPLIESGTRLASTWLNRDVTLATADDGSGEVADLIMDDSGTARYAVVEFGGLLEMGNNQVVVEVAELDAAPAGEPFNLSMTQDELREAPKFHYEADEAP